MSVEAQSASREIGVAAPPRGMVLLRAIALQAGLVLLTLAGLELFLRVADFREVRLIPEQVQAALSARSRARLVSCSRQDHPTGRSHQQHRASRRRACA